MGKFQALLWRRFSKQAYASLVMLKTCSILTLNLLLCFALAAAEDYPVGDKPFRRYVAKGTDGQRITFYLSTQQSASHPVPLIVWIQGTGCSSQFVSVDGRMSRGLQGVLYSVARGRARILAVEKPGVEFLDDPPDDGDAGACRPGFRTEFTLDRWATTIADAIQTAQKMPGGRAFEDPRDRHFRGRHRSDARLERVASSHARRFLVRRRTSLSISLGGVYA